MGAPSLDNLFMQYWSQLTVVQKESLLNVAKNYVQLKLYDVNEDERMEMIMKDREDYLNGIGKTYTREEARKQVLNNQKKDGLPD